MHAAGYSRTLDQVVSSKVTQSTPGAASGHLHFPHKHGHLRVFLQTEHLSPWDWLAFGKYTRCRGFEELTKTFRILCHWWSTHQGCVISSLFFLKQTEVLHVNLFHCHRGLKHFWETPKSISVKPCAVQTRPASLPLSHTTQGLSLKLHHGPMQYEILKWEIWFSRTHQKWYFWTMRKFEFEY